MTAPAPRTQARNRRSGVEDRWHTAQRVPRIDRDGQPKLDKRGNPLTDPVKSANYGKGKRWRARYVDDEGREHAKGFERKTDAEAWLDTAVSSLVQGTHVAPRDARTTVTVWCERWLEGYKINRTSTVRQARTHIAQIEAEFGHLQLSAIRPSMVKAWVANLKADGVSTSYVYALHSRLRQILDAAVHDGLLGRNPCSRQTAPPMGSQKPYVITTGELWAIHDAMPEHLRAAVLLGAFAGLRIAEVSALKVSDVDFVRGVVFPKRQWPDEPLKTKGSSAPIPVPRELTLMLSASLQQWPGEFIVTDGAGGAAPPWIIERALRSVKEGDASGVPEEFSFHDLRHYLASLLISKGADIKTVQARMRHASATTTLNTYSHLWPDADESTRTAIGEVLAERMDSSGVSADVLRTETVGS
ncbi:tyrosine-type recombinase/integrase [Rhodococcus opacus]|uniref:tyrosine-type recombinase/integrase n=1 Tax=Rhodococcus opacus TaxID=37919 RepID=UPI00155A1A55|nr:site-specific integrase [Rhodococcus opacus]